MSVKESVEEVNVVLWIEEVEGIVEETKCLFQFTPPAWCDEIELLLSAFFLL